MKMYLTYEQKIKGDSSSLPNVTIPPGMDRPPTIAIDPFTTYTPEN